jgi:hypothetical protein
VLPPLEPERRRWLAHALELVHPAIVGSQPFLTDQSKIL